MHGRLRSQILDSEPEALDIQAQEPVAGVEELAASLRVLPGQESLAHRVDAAAGAVPRLEHRHAMAGALQLEGAHEPGQPGTDHDHVDGLGRRCGERSSGPEGQSGPGRSGQQLAAREERAQEKSSYAGSVRNSTKSGSSATCWKSSAAGRYASPSCPSSSATTSSTCPFSTRPCRTHCQICDREISAVAASSIRLLIAAAPVPASHAAMYWMPTETFSRTPSSLTSPGVDATSRSCAAVTDTSSRCLDTWFGRSPSTLSNSARAVGTRSGCATHVPSNPSPASRILSSETFSSATALISGSRRDGMNAAMRSE